MAKLTPTSRRVTAHYAQSSQAGILQVLEFDKRARVHRAIKTGAVCLATTAACVCIPGAHFVLVPLGILLTPLMVYMSVKATTKIVDSAVTCPHCGKSLPILASQERYPLYENCLSCKREIKIVSAE
jgi:hypothetical protein